MKNIKNMDQQVPKPKGLEELTYDQINVLNKELPKYKMILGVNHFNYSCSDGTLWLKTEEGDIVTIPISNLNR